MASYGQPATNLPPVSTNNGTLMGPSRVLRHKVMETLSTTRPVVEGKKPSRNQSTSEVMKNMLGIIILEKYIFYWSSSSSSSSPLSLSTFGSTGTLSNIWGITFYLERYLYLDKLTTNYPHIQKIFRYPPSAFPCSLASPTLYLYKQRKQSNSSALNMQSFLLGLS